MIIPDCFLTVHYSFVHSRIASNCIGGKNIVFLIDILFSVFTFFFCFLSFSGPVLGRVGEVTLGLQFIGFRQQKPATACSLTLLSRFIFGLRLVMRLEWRWGLFHRLIYCCTCAVQTFIFQSCGGKTCPIFTNC